MFPANKLHLEVPYGVYRLHNKFNDRVRMKIKILLFSMFATAGNALGASSSSAKASLGDVSSNLFNAEMGVHDFIQAVCITAGIAVILGSFFQFKKYRDNPVATRLSTVVFNFFIGLVLIALAFVPFQL